MVGKPRMRLRLFVGIRFCFDDGRGICLHCKALLHRSAIKGHEVTEIVNYSLVLFLSLSPISTGRVGKAIEIGRGGGEGS